MSGRSWVTIRGAIASLFPDELRQRIGQLIWTLAHRGSAASLVRVTADYLPGPDAVVGVLTEDRSIRLLRMLRAAHPSLDFHQIHGTGSVSHAAMTVLGPFDLLIDARSSDRRRRFLDSFYQLRAGGVLIVRGAGFEVDRDRGTALSQLLVQARAWKGRRTPSQKRDADIANHDAHTLGHSLAELTRAGHHLVAVTAVAPPLAKLNEEEMNVYLRQRPAEGKILEVIPPAPFESRCLFRENTAEPRPDHPSRYDTIEISLRQYPDVVVSPAQVVSNDRVIMPDSFRHNQTMRLRNRYLREVAPRFARLRHPVTDLPYLEGSYVQLDSEFRGHYGHLMTEQMSRFWSWQRARQIDPSCKALVALNKKRELQSWELEIFAAAGIAESDIHFLRKPARVERLIAGTPLLSNPHYVHPMITETWREVGDKLVQGATGVDLPERIFCSRRLDKRSCHNTPEVDAYFADHGFEVIYPEEHSLGDQVQLFRQAEVIAGFSGSALLTLCFAEQPKRVITISSTAYTARNEYLIASLLGHQIDSVTCVPDQPDFYQSEFRFDFDREGQFLAEVLASLPRR